MFQQQPIVLGTTALPKKNQSRRDHFTYLSALFALSLTLVTGCDDGEAEDKTTDPSPLPSLIRVDQGVDKRDRAVNTTPTLTEERGVNQANEEAARLYQLHCASCHGVTREGVSAPQLIDLNAWEEEALRERIEVTMPPADPERCVGDCAVIISRWLLQEGTGEAPCPPAAEIPPAEALLPRRLRLLDRRSLVESARAVFVPNLTSPSQRASVALNEGIFIPEERASAMRDEGCAPAIFRYQPGADDGSPEEAHVAGEFNDWAESIATGGLPFEVTGNGDWVASAALPAGRYLYKFVLAGERWISDPAAQTQEADGYGGFNSIFEQYCDATGDDPRSEFVPEEHSVDSLADQLDALVKTLPAHPRPSHFPFAGYAEGAQLGATGLEALFLLAEEIAPAVAMSITRGVCAETIGDVEAGLRCLRGLVTRYAPLAFRREISAEEQRSLTEFAQAEAALEGGLGSLEGRRAGAEVLVLRLLTTPQFLYRSELGEPVDGGRYRLTPAEILSAVSYFIVGAPPSPEQLALAGEELYTSEARVELAEELLAGDLRSSWQLLHFLHAWLGVEGLDELVRDDPQSSGELAETLRHAMAMELDALALKNTAEERPLAALLSGDEGYLSAPLAEHYQLAEPSAGWQPLPPERRAGILSLGAVLTRYAHSDQSSPIRRGLFVRERLLCQPLPPPPPEAGGLPPVNPEASTRERFQQHSADPSCSTCHRYIDEIGFVFEGFDSVGVFRDEEGGQPIETHGLIRDLEGLGVGSEATVEDLPELAALIAESDAFRRCTLRQVYRFNAGAEPSPETRCRLKTLEERFIARGASLHALRLALIEESGFIYRREEAP
ncbi:MAG: DUF1588 domain-containing protein [Myxococcota bacterium]|nr:DUF1588 domain-containing protein [Myxococcota bacterium]